MSTCSTGSIIPPITDPLGAHWKQPPTAAILLDDTHAVMSRETFELLPEYSASRPTGAYVGKMWKRHDGAFDYAFIARGGRPKWLLCWYGTSERGAEWVTTNTRELLIA